jgi:hypothetical protein
MLSSLLEDLKDETKATRTHTPTWQIQRRS